MKVLGIDTSLRSTGIAVVEQKGNRLSAVDMATLKVSRTQPLSACLHEIDLGITAMLEKQPVDAASIEGAFFFKNARTAMTLGEARGVAMAACARQGVEIFEYAPRRVKQAVVGFGNADKEQVRKMIMQLLNLTEEPQEDAGDALALAVCHLQSMSAHAALAPEPI